MASGGMSIGQVKKQLKLLAKSRDQYIMYIGQLAFEDYRNEKLTSQSLREPCATLQDIYDQMGLWEEQLGVLQSIRNARVGQICPYCRAPVLAGAVFCNSCGKSIAQAAPAEGEEDETAGEQIAVSCPVCASPALDDASFCPACGWRLVEEGDGGEEQPGRGQAREKNGE